MPALQGFTGNNFVTRDDLVRAATALLAPLSAYKSPSSARIKLPVTTGTVFDDVAAQLEGFARPLFAVAPLLLHDLRRTDSSPSPSGNSLRNLGLESWLQGLRAGVDPDSSEYWGDIVDGDQRMVETESIAFALLLVPDIFLSALDETAKQNLSNWLRSMNGKAMPENNWRWFRILANLALQNVLKVDHDRELQDQIDADFALLDSFYIGEGWSSDGLWAEEGWNRAGLWRPERRQADYYSGSFAMHFAQLLYVRFSGKDDERTRKYREQAGEFAGKFWRYFDVDGAAIPFGRSMTYRFAFAAFWAAASLAKVDLPAPLDDVGFVKGLLLRHLRWWASEHRASLFSIDGTPTIGFTYPNMYMGEDYNSPQSVFWCLKSFVALALPQDDPFWLCEEKPHPLDTYASAATPSASRSLVEVVRPPGHIICSTPEHHFLLSSGQGTSKTFKGREAKYGKFAYSSAFGFSVPTGPLLHQRAPDSTLCVSLDDGESWRVLCDPFDVRVKDIRVETGGGGDPQSHIVPALRSWWRPFGFLDVVIETHLIPVVEHFPGWHVRVHWIDFRRLWESSPATTTIDLVDAGFAISSENSAGTFLSEVGASQILEKEGWTAGKDACLVYSSQAGMSGVVDLTTSVLSKRQAPTEVISEAFRIRADPNTNLIAPRTLIPAVKHQIRVPQSLDTVGVCLVTGVYATSSAPGGLSGDKAAQDSWLRRPRVRILDGEESSIVIQAEP